MIDVQPAETGRIVHVRIGAFRRAYHPDATCPALNDKVGTYRGQESMAEAKAQELGLALCGKCPPARPQPVDEEFADRPMYEVPRDERHTARPFTVVVNGPDRHHGYLPHWFVIEEYSSERAWAKVLAWYMVENETVDAYVIASRCFQGASGKDFYTDLRPEYARQAALDDLADQAAEMVEQFHKETRDLVREDGQTRPGQEGTYETALGDVAFSAWPLVLEIAANDGRD